MVTLKNLLLGSVVLPQKEKHQDPVGATKGSFWVFFLFLQMEAKTAGAFRQRLGQNQ